MKAVVGEDKGTVVEAVGKEKGKTGVDQGVDKAADKIEGKLLK